MNAIGHLKSWAKSLKKKVVMLWFATQHPETPFLPKIICIFVVAYAFSPIDLIPDFIPILGFLDDVILLPALIWVALRLIPEKVIADSTQKSEEWWLNHAAKPKSNLGLILVLLVWMSCAIGLYLSLQEFGFFNRLSLQL
jgi:uncharacterized membrane protein YkvA (DUF1232 family)